MTASTPPPAFDRSRTLRFEVKTQRTYYECRHFQVPEGASVEETAAAIQADLQENSYTFIGHPEVCGATLIADYEVMSDEPEYKVLGARRLGPEDYPLARAAD
jgi:hypothetical protein